MDRETEGPRVNGVRLSNNKKAPESSPGQVKEAVSLTYTVSPEESIGGCMATPKLRECPEGGNINFDFGIYPACRSDCHIRDTCKKQHNVDAVQNKESFHFSFFYIEAGLLCNQELTADEAILLGYIAYRSQEFRYCNETNERLCRLLKKLKKDKAEPVSERTIGRILKRLKDKEYLETRYLRRLKSNGVFYQTSRKLLLTNKAVSSMNIFRTDRDKPYYLDHSDGGKLKQR